MAQPSKIVPAIGTPDIRSLSLEELRAEFVAWGEPAYRLEQVLDWLYRKHATGWGAMTNLPRTLRERMANRFTLVPITLATKQGSVDSTQKFLWKLKDGALIESVLIPSSPALYGEPSDRQTLCVSTQVGCAYGCKFCASGLDGWKRNLGVEEIVDQVLAVERLGTSEPAESSSSEPAAARLGNGEGRLIHNLVIMGMGEPLANYTNLLKALRILNAPWGGGIGARKITVSTSGLVPEIRKLADEPVQFRLAISLHGATDDVRGRVMPINRKYPLVQLTAACEYYLRKRGRMLTFEYILLAGVNDSLDQVPPLARLAQRLHAKINLIPYNAVEGLPWQRPSDTAQDRFLAALRREKVSATLRREKGHDIDAACGQLRLRHETSP